MHEVSTQATVIIVAAVLLFFMLGIAILVIIDHKARLPGGFTNDPFSLTGMRRDHPVVAFITATILLSIIAALVFELTVAVSGILGVDFMKEEHQIVTILSEERNLERTRHFHNLPDKFQPTQGEKSICFYCHGDFPHSKEPMIRTLMNMHTQFTGCVSCHVDEKKIPEKDIQLRWLNYSGIEVKGKPFGMDYDPDSGDLNQTDDYFSKIVAYKKSAGEEVLLEIGPGDPALVEFNKVKDSLSNADKEALKNRYHKNVRPNGRKCSRCHINEQDSYIPFRELGFSERRIDDLTNLNLVGLIEKYKRFYITDLKGTGASDKTKSASAIDKDRVKQEHMKKDLRSWWNETYDSPTGK
ncbi:MAG: cytochrome c family protein [Gammaproteobacteria bacterium]|nr:cytochrome c family protein [Gammaproteobacteria bacterium]